MLTARCLLVRGAMIALLVVGPSVAFAADPGIVPIVHGHWVGKWKCEVFRGQKEKTANAEVAVEIRHVTQDIVMLSIDGVLVRGALAPKLDKPTQGELAYFRCGSDDGVGGTDELGRFKYSVKGEKGTLSGTTVYTDGPNAIGTCKYSFKRVDTVTPAISLSCP